MRETMKSGAWFVAGCLLAACATGDTVEIDNGSSNNSSSGDVGGNGGNGIGGPGNAGTGGIGGTGGTGGTGSSGPDAIPQNAIGFFQIPVCPNGWEPYAAAAGRAILPTIGPQPGGATVGTPLASGEDRKHAHPVKATFELIDISYVGIAGASNMGVAKAGLVSFTATSNAASTGLPYVQLLTCKKTAVPESSTAVLPTRMQLYFDAATCPTGWKQAPATQGRFIVGAPKGAPADVSFGGDPISTTTPRTHTHGNQASFNTVTHGIALAAGCCGSGFAKNATYSSSESTGEGDAALPWIELLHCEKL